MKCAKVTSPIVSVFEYVIVQDRFNVPFLS